MTDKKKWPKPKKILIHRIDIEHTLKNAEPKSDMFPTRLRWRNIPKKRYRRSNDCL